MKPYDPSARCPKCGSADVSTDHVEKNGGNYWSGCSECSRVNVREHLHRLCPRCLYAWPEACVPVKHD